jgi:phosphoribosylaminoimidazole-succinocarboxamide synthase
MNLWIGVAPTIAQRHLDTAHVLIKQLRDLGFDAAFAEARMQAEAGAGVYIDLVPALNRQQPTPRQVALDGPETLLERTLRVLPLNVEELPLLVEGESKIVRLWTNNVVAIRFKPMVYSVTTNSYRPAPGTDVVRARFTSQLFREMARCEPRDGVTPHSAFLAEIPSPAGPLVIQRKVETCNIETRIKRYHIGSPLHRYRYTERYPTTQSAGPLKRWTRFDQPVVCFDWRHPLRDEAGNDLADEPISDDYAGVWMRDIDYAKRMARSTFLWLEQRFERAGIRLIDMCIFIGQDGRTIYGEISPDCMRARLDTGDLAAAEAEARGQWWPNGAPDQLQYNYEDFYQRVFGAD